MPEQIYTSLLIQIYETKNALTFFFYWNPFKIKVLNLKRGKTLVSKHGNIIEAIINKLFT